jgi:hypothetical protein
MKILLIVLLVYLLQWYTLFCWIRESRESTYVETPDIYEVLGLLFIPGSIIYVIIKHI